MSIIGEECTILTVIDLRDDMYKRRIDVIEIDDGVIYYAEELKTRGADSVCIYGCSLDDGAEQLLSCFVFDDSGYYQHYYTGKNSIIILFENSGSTVWIVKIDKKTGSEMYRRRIPLIGAFCDCVAVDDDNILIYTKSDNEHKDMFNRCLESTNCSLIAHLYDLSKCERYFVRDFETVMLVRNNMQTFTANGEEWMLLNDSFGNAKEKQRIIQKLSISDNELEESIRVISKNAFLSAVRKKEHDTKPKKIVTAGSKGSVQLECICGENILLRARSFVNTAESYCSIPRFGGKITNVLDINGEAFFTDSDEGKVYSISRTGDETELIGRINSDVHITYPVSIGRLVKCIYDRYVIGETKGEKDYITVYDSELDMKDVYQASGTIKGSVLVLY